MLKSFNELIKFDISGYIEKRDNAEYLGWSNCLILLHENGAETVSFKPILNDLGSSLFMSEQVFTDKNGNTNRCYEVHVEVIIDGKRYEQSHPVMNGNLPVKDNSMNQLRVWNSITRAFVKCVVVNTGLGFNLWLKEEHREEEEDLYKHRLGAVKDRINERITSLLTPEFGIEDLAKKIGTTSDEIRATMSYFKIINDLEKKLRSI